MRHNFIKDWMCVILIIFLYSKCAKALEGCKDPNLGIDAKAVYAAALHDYKHKRSTKDPRALRPITEEYPWRMIRQSDWEYMNATGRLP